MQRISSSEELSEGFFHDINEGASLWNLTIVVNVGQLVAPVTVIALRLAVHLYLVIELQRQAVPGLKE